MKGRPLLYGLCMAFALLLKFSPGLSKPYMFVEPDMNLKRKLFEELSYNRISALRIRSQFLFMNQFMDYLEHLKEQRRSIVFSYKFYNFLTKFLEFNSVPMYLKYFDFLALSHRLYHNHVGLYLEEK